MIRRSFRFGLLLGLLAGVAFAVTKVFGSRPRPDARSAEPPTEPWPRLVTDPAAPAATATPVPEPAGADLPFVPDPAAPSPVAPVVEEAVVEPKKNAALKAWVDPEGGVCPTSHPVKAKLTSKIFHLPGMLNYERTNPDRCYADQAKAEADGLRAAKR